MKTQLEQIKGIVSAGETTISLFCNRIPYNRYYKVLAIFGYNSNYNSGVGEVGIYDQLTKYPLLSIESGVHYLLPKFSMNKIILQNGECLYIYLTDCFAADIISFNIQYEICGGK